MADFKEGADYSQTPIEGRQFELPNIMQEFPEAKGYDGTENFFDHISDVFSRCVDGIKDMLGIKDFREYNDSYVEKVSDAAKAIFTSEIVHNWSALSMEQRSGVLNQYAHSIGEVMGINICGIVVDDLYASLGYGTQGMNNGQGILYLDYRDIADPWKLSEVIDTVTHEARHQFQREAIMNPERYDVPSETIAAWWINIRAENYVRQEDDYEAYLSQPVESDAWNFAGAVIHNLNANLNR